jgi:hypothetical protein
MGRTVRSYRIATEMERSKCKTFRQRLNKDDRKEFDKMFSYSRLCNSVASLMCIVFEHYKQLDRIQNEDL